MWDEQFEEILRRFLPFLAAEEALHRDTELRDLGLDSLSTVELLGALEGSYGATFEEDSLTLETFRTPGVLWGALTSAVARTG